MERTVPQAASEEIELYLRTYYSLLRASSEVRLRSLEEVHAGMNSLLHPLARSSEIDMSAFVYSVLRLPKEIVNVERVVLGQSFEIFKQNGIGILDDWQEVGALARRRLCYYDQKDTLACLISSRSDIDDLVPILTAYQIEWNKLHVILQDLPDGWEFSGLLEDKARCEELAQATQLEEENITRLAAIWGGEFEQIIEAVADRRIDLRIQLLNGSLTEYRRATHLWWQRIAENTPQLDQRPVYFVSSNPHSLVNMVSGFALQNQQPLLDFLADSEDMELKEEWEKINADEVPSSEENFLYYLLKKALATPEGAELAAARQKIEEASSIFRIKSEHSFDITAQVISLADLNPAMIDPRLKTGGNDVFKQSDALILNIDYPLGLAAYQVLTEVADNVGKVLGIYIIGKAATLNGVVGDVMIPNVVYDGHSLNTFIFSNCFSAADVSPFLVYGTALDNQKAITVQGTFLQNIDYMDVFYREGYTDIEMEGGPYLSAVYEMLRPKRHPTNEVVSFHDLPFDFGMLHYASDKPMSKGTNLGAANLSYFGMDPSYATAAAALKRIFEVERLRLQA
ncbi:MAG: hypothetical protein ABFS17_03340 [Chloroflexota bacterium]